MEEEWSLKGKKYTLYIGQHLEGATFYDDVDDETTPDEETPLIKYTGEDGVKVVVRKEEDIETLRKKLIEKLCYEFIIDKEDTGGQDHISQSTIYDTINKLFGVKNG